MRHVWREARLPGRQVLFALVPVFFVAVVAVEDAGDFAFLVVFEGEAGEAAGGIEEGVGVFGLDFENIALGVVEEHLLALALDSSDENVVGIAVLADVGIKERRRELQGDGVEGDQNAFGEGGGLR